MDGPICKLNLTSDGSGAHHGWYCNYVKVITMGAHIPCAQQFFFIVEQWVATDASLMSFTVSRDVCPNPDADSV